LFVGNLTEKSFQGLQSGTPKLVWGWCQKLPLQHFIFALTPFLKKILDNPLKLFYKGNESFREGGENPPQPRYCKRLRKLF